MVTNKTLANYPYQSPTPRDLIADLIRGVDDAGARTIGVDFYFVRPTEPERDDALVAAVLESHAKVVLGAVDRRYTVFTEDEYRFQDAFLKRMGTTAGHIDLQHESDDVVRYTSLAPDPNFSEAFAWRIAKTAGGKELPDRSRIAWLVGPDRNVDPFLSIPAEDVLGARRDSSKARELADKVKDKIVLMSGEYPYVDRHRTPLSIRTGEKQSGVKIHAHIVAQHLDGRRYFELARGHADTVIAGVGAAGFLLGWLFWRRRLDFLGLTAATIILIAADAFIYWNLRMILPFTLALWAWVIGVTAGHHLHTALAPVLPGKARAS